MNLAAESADVGAALGDEEFSFLRRLVYQRSRIHLSADKKVLVAARLAGRLRQLQLAGYGEYCALLCSPAGEEELRFLIDRISTHHTQFFRERRHFDFLREKVYPSWQAPSGARAQPFHLWSAACSTGEEPYSLAMHLAEHFAPAATNTWQLEASDISTRVLEIAERGIYETDKLAGVGPELLRRHFQQGVREREGQFRVKAGLRGRVRFHHLNLLQPPYPFPQLFDVILCRNVMIYFDRATQELLVNHLAGRLAPGGHLLVGHSESLSGIPHPLQSVQASVYLKPQA